MSDTNFISGLIDYLKEHKKNNTTSKVLEASQAPVEEESTGKFAVTDKLAEDLGKVLNIDFTVVSRDEFKKGLEVEQEHVDVTQGDPEITGKIALAHLKEMPDYYTKLSAMEKGSGVKEATPPGAEYVVKGIKKSDVAKNPFAIAWWLRNQGAKFRKGPHAGHKMASVESIDKVIEDISKVTTPDLDKVDISKLDPIEKMQYNRLINDSTKEEVLQILINSSEGDFSQLSDELRKYAEKDNTWKNESIDDEPGEDDITTEDHEHWYQYGKLYFTGDYNDLKKKMDADKFYPNVFFISDHGNAHLITENVNEVCFLVWDKKSNNIKVNDDGDVLQFPNSGKAYSYIADVLGEADRYELLPRSNAGSASKADKPAFAMEANYKSGAQRRNDRMDKIFAHYKNWQKKVEDHALKVYGKAWDTMSDEEKNKVDHEVADAEKKGKNEAIESNKKIFNKVKKWLHGEQGIEALNTASDRYYGFTPDEDGNSWQGGFNYNEHGLVEYPFNYAFVYDRKEGTFKTAEEVSKSKNEATQDSLKIIARSLSDKADADRVALNKKGRVIADDKDPKKFMVVVQESVINEVKFVILDLKDMRIRTKSDNRIMSFDSQGEARDFVTKILGTPSRYEILACTNSGLKGELMTNTMESQEVEHFEMWNNKSNQHVDLGNITQDEAVAKAKEAFKKDGGVWLIYNLTKDKYVKQIDSISVANESSEHVIDEKAMKEAIKKEEPDASDELINKIFAEQVSTSTGIIFLKQEKDDEQKALIGDKKVKESNASMPVTENSASYEVVPVSVIRVGDTVINKAGQVVTVGKNDIKNDKFMGITLFGDSYKLGTEKITRVVYRNKKVKEGNSDPKEKPPVVCPKCGEPVWDVATVDQRLNKCHNCGLRFDMPELEEKANRKIDLYADGNYLLSTMGYSTVKDAIASVAGKDEVEVAGRGLVPIKGKKIIGRIVKESVMSDADVEIDDLVKSGANDADIIKAVAGKHHLYPRDIKLAIQKHRMQDTAVERIVEEVYKIWDRIKLDFVKDGDHDAYFSTKDKAREKIIALGPQKKRYEILPESRQLREDVTTLASLSKEFNTPLVDVAQMYNTAKALRLKAVNKTSLDALDANDNKFIMNVVRHRLRMRKANGGTNA